MLLLWRAQSRSLPRAPESETVIIQFAHLLGQHNFLLSLVAGVVLAGILACTMSTADSQLLTAASGVSQNLLQDFLKIKMSTAASMMTARLTVVGIAIVGVFLAWNPDSSVFYIVSFCMGRLRCRIRPAGTLRPVLEAH